MSEKPVVIIISDLHLGGGPSDPGDDHVYDDDQLRDFLQGHLLESPEGRRGEIELFINGDLLDFAQTEQSAYTLGSETAWCSEPESLKKLEVMLAGHADIFEAMKRFQEPGNAVTIAAGNHDVEFFWPSVQAKIRAKAGAVQFVLAEEWSSRFGGKLRIAHGHQLDVANKFSHWSQPFVKGPGGEDRLEMCVGTLFMVKFLNWLEKKYPFADNIKPISAMARVLAREDKLGTMAVAWVLMTFFASHPQAALECRDRAGLSRNFPRVLVDAVQSDAKVGNLFRTWYRLYVDPSATDAAIEKGLLKPDNLKKLLLAVIAKEDPSAWEALMKISLAGATLGDEEGTLTLIEAQKIDDMQLFREKARETLMGSEAQIVILGHTHLPDQVNFKEGKQYFNLGSWTRYADVSTQKDLRLKDLQDESRYPYQLNYVRVEMGGAGVLGTFTTYRELKRP